MTLIQTLRSRWRIAAALFALTLVGAVGAFVKLPWTYSASSSVLLLPSQSSAKVVGGNRYLAFTYTLTQTANVLTYEMSDPRTAQALQAAGYTSGYTVENMPAATAPVLLVTVTGSNKAMVEHTLSGVTDKITTELAAGQTGLTDHNVISAQTVAFTLEPTRLSNKKARPLIVVFGVGVLLTLAVPSLVESSARRRGRRNANDADLNDGADDELHHYNPDLDEERHGGYPDERAGQERRQPQQMQGYRQPQDNPGPYQQLPPHAAANYRNTRV